MGRRVVAESLPRERFDAGVERPWARLEDLFIPGSDAGDGMPNPTAAEPAAKTSLTMVLSWRKCSGWIADWDALE